jgi:hypothetical protein
MTQTKGRLGRCTGRLWRSKAAFALTEFAYAAPIFAAIGLGGIEIANYTLAHLRVSQVASNLADVMSRTGEDTGLGLKRITETQINQALDAVELQARGLELVDRGRIILSSLEQASDGSQWVRWQRCHGDGDFDPLWGEQGDGKRKKDDFDGMGPDGAQAQSPDNSSAVMFVEVHYEYKPLINVDALGLEGTIASRAAFLVRDRRDLSTSNNPANPGGETRRKCNGSDPDTET